MALSPLSATRLLRQKKAKRFTWTRGDARGMRVDPEFERKHPRAEGGRFGEKPDEAGPSLDVATPAPAKTGIEGFVVDFEEGADPVAAKALWDKHMAGVDPLEFQASMLNAFGGGHMRITDPSKSDGKLGILLNKEGMGSVRFFSRNAAGELEVEHFLTEIDLDHTGQGLAKPFLSKSMDYYEQLGVKRITLKANMQLGGYAWLKYGFTPNKASWDELRPRLGVMLQGVRNRQGPGYAAGRHPLKVTDESFAEVENILANPDPQAAWALADLQIPLPTAKQENIGKSLLMFKDWEGGMELDDPVAMARFNAYVGRDQGPSLDAAMPFGEMLGIRPKRTTLADADIEIKGDVYLEEDKVNALFRTTIGDPIAFKQRLSAGMPGEVRLSITDANPSDPEIGRTAELGIRADFFDADGKAYGHAERLFSRTRFGGLEVTHGIFTLHDHMQGKGIAKTFMGNSMSEYRRIGVYQIHMRANIDVGGYAWAKYGFKLDPTETAEMATTKAQVKDRIKRVKDRAVRVTLSTLSLKRPSSPAGTVAEMDKLATALDSDNPNALWAIADSKYGKDLLINADWYGVLRLDDEEAMNRFDKYVGRG